MLLTSLVIPYLPSNYSYRTLISANGVIGLNSVRDCVTQDLEFCMSVKMVSNMLKMGVCGENNIAVGCKKSRAFM